MKVLGSLTICMEKVFTLGKTVEDTKVNMNKIKSMVMGYTYGQMVEGMKATG